MNISSDEKQVIIKYLKLNKGIQQILDIITNFRIMIYSANEEKLRKWIEDTRKKNINEINKFINGIINDYEAVKNCLLYLNQSNGVAEGKITKIKSIKRTMYGRVHLTILEVKFF